MTYVPALLFLALAIVFVAGGLVSSAVLGGRGRRSRTRLDAYECGVGPLDSPRRSFHVRFYVTAILFILFDLEAVYLYPWAVLYRDLKLFGLVEMGIFIAILVLGYVYAWKKEALEWV